MGLKHCSDGWENSERMSEIMTFSSKMKFMNQLILLVLYTQSKDTREESDVTILKG